MFKQALEIAKRALGEEHPNVASTMHLLAHVLKAQGNAKEAARMGKQALAIREKALGQDHPYTQEARKDWG